VFKDQNIFNIFNISEDEVLYHFEFP